MDTKTDHMVNRIAADLRRQAEMRILENAPTHSPPGTAEETERLVHELEVHRIELEMQNSELRLVRDELERALEKHTDLYDFAPVGYFTLNRNGDITAANLSGAAFLGIERASLLGQRFKRFVSANDRPFFSDFVHKVFVSRSKVSCEVPLTIEGDQPRFVQVEAVASNSGLECRLALIDISGRRHAEDALQESEERMYKLAEMAVDAIIMLDDSGTVTFCNAATERMFGAPASEITGREFHHLFIPERLRELSRQGFASFREHGTGPVIGTTTEVTALRKDGTEFPLELSISAVKISGNWHAIGIMRDASERKSLEAHLQQAEKMETVVLLTGGIANDIDTILTVIAGYGSFSEMGMKVDDPLRANLDRIIAAADRGAAIIGSLLNFSRKQPVTPLPIDINETVRGLEAFLKMVIGEDIRFETTYTAEVLKVTADSGQLEQVLISLATNARHAMPDGGRLSIRTEAVCIDPEFIALHGFGEQGKYAFISVTDTGTGMGPETVRRIFEPFFTTRAHGKGTGLGLSVVYGIIRRHNGFIDVSSQPDAGTTFKLYLPFSDAAVE